MPCTVVGCRVYSAFWPEVLELHTIDQNTDFVILLVSFVLRSACGCGRSRLVEIAYVPRYWDRNTIGETLD